MTATVASGQKGRFEFLCADIVLNVDIDEEFLGQRSLTDFAYRERHMQTYRQYLADGKGRPQQAPANP